MSENVLHAVRICPAHGSTTFSQYINTKGFAFWQCLLCCKVRDEKKRAWLKAGHIQEERETKKEPKHHPVCQSCWIEHPVDAECV